VGRAFRVEKVSLEQGPGFSVDEFRVVEFRVVEIATHRIILRFLERGSAHAGVDPSYEGVSRVSIDEDETHAVVYHHGRAEPERIALH
jgi:hypothetical protein